MNLSGLPVLFDVLPTENTLDTFPKLSKFPARETVDEMACVSEVWFENKFIIRNSFLYVMIS